MIQSTSSSPTTSFATIDTPGGFPMPDIPKYIDSSYSPNCEEFDADNCVRELINQKNWTTKIYDEEFIEGWSPTVSWKWSPDVIRYAVEECRWRWNEQQKWQQDCVVGTPVAICKAGLVLARDDISQELCSSIMDDIQNLQQDQENETSMMTTMAFHPKHKKKIRHLVHPSLYPYEKGVTHVLPDVGAEAVSAPSWNNFLGVEGVVADDDKPLKINTKGLRNHRHYGNSNHRFDDVEPPTAAECSTFQMLPSEFYVSLSSANVSSPASTDTVITTATTHTTTKPTCSINSYINNLHPIKYRSLYNRIGELFVEALPMLEEVLSEVNDNGKVREQLPRFESEERDHLRSSPDEIAEPPIPEFSPPEYTAKKETVILHDRPLQVIVKLISMELQPTEQPDFDSMTSEEFDQYCCCAGKRSNYFPGGNWHVEGTYEERIVASAYCCLESENLKEKGISFRDGSIGSGGTELGTCEMPPGRILAWPNYLHNKMCSALLDDDERPGRRTVCCFHLVDPTLRIRSTATVPPQQSSWVTDMINSLILSSPSLSNPSSLLEALHNSSMTIKDGSTINYQEALKRRARLWKERSADVRVIANHFSLPNHVYSQR